MNNNNYSATIWFNAFERFNVVRLLRPAHNNIGYMKKKEKCSSVRRNTNAILLIYWILVFAILAAIKFIYFISPFCILVAWTGALISALSDGENAQRTYYVWKQMLKIANNSTRQKQRETEKYKQNGWFVNVHDSNDARSTTTSEYWYLWARCGRHRIQCMFLYEMT